MHKNSTKEDNNPPAIVASFLVKNNGPNGIVLSWGMHMNTNAKIFWTRATLVSSGQLQFTVLAGGLAPTF